MFKLWLTLPILLTACLKDEAVSGYADRDLVFALKDWNGQAFEGRATISFPERGKVAGDAPCNRYTASLTVPYPWFGLDRITATRRACPDMAQEAAFFEALRRASLVVVSGPVLTLSNDDGLEMVFLAAKN